jgi:hypothetical protein
MAHPRRTLPVGPDGQAAWLGTCHRVPHYISSWGQHFAEPETDCMSCQLVSVVSHRRAQLGFSVPLQDGWRMSMNPCVYSKVFDTLKDFCCMI